MFSYLPKLAHNIWPSVHSCLVSDLDKNGMPHALSIQRVDPAKDDGSCALPDGLRLTYTQFFIAYILGLGAGSILQLNMIYYVLYRFEFPFIEQFKCVSDPWPWKTDPEGFRKQAIKGLVQCMFNNTVIAFFNMSF